ncbi:MULTISPECIES: Mu transposase C-terminal domain-containing protein [unclassified Azospirillum]|uniref:Mu transposase C-terminal domain-containing protein n=1 Tax=unclassified Azospirillum TaxID=2630922 RepID=UPI000B786AE9|nr:MULTISPECIES: Mu transposase C-terminal domain-containing protein [unclassified Azospirillum]
MMMQHSVVHYRLTKHDQVVLNGQAYRPVSTSDRGHHLARVEDNDVREFLPHDEIARFAQAGTLIVKQGFYLPETAARRAKGRDVALFDLPQDEQRRILRRKAYCEMFMEMEAKRKDVTRSDVSMKIAIAEIHAQIVRDEATATRATSSGSRPGRRASCEVQVNVSLPPTPSTLRRWLRDFRDGGFVAVALCSNTKGRGNRTPRKSGDAWALVNQHVGRYASANRDSKIMIYRDYRMALDEKNRERSVANLEPLESISYQTFWKHLNRTLDPFTVTAGRYGAEAARQKFNIIYGRDPVGRPLEVVEMDEWQVSLQVLLSKSGIWELLTDEQREKIGAIGRVWVSVAIDCATRCILAMRFTTAPSSASAIATLEMVVRDKSEIAGAVGCRSPWNMHGIPETVSMDNGPSFRAEQVKLAIAALGAGDHYPPAGVPELRGRIERVFGTFQREFARYFQGQTFSNPVEKGDYDAERHASVNLETLNRTLVRYVVDAYHNRPHAELAGATPLQTWNRLVAQFGVLPPPDDDTRRCVFGIPCQRRISNQGVRILGIHYQSRELQELRRKAGLGEVTVKVGRWDLGRVSVQTPDGWISVPPAMDGLALDGVTWWEWTAAARDLGRRNADMEHLSSHIVADAIRSIRGQADEADAAAELGSAILGTDELERIEKRLFTKFDFKARGGRARELPGLEAEGEQPGDTEMRFETSPPIGRPASSPTPAADGTHRVYRPAASKRFTTEE